MAGYSTAEEALADGFTVEHDPASQRFLLLRDGEVMGTAHYTLLGDTGIDFDGTEVTPALRGTGLAAILAHRAFTDKIRSGRELHTSCWFMAGYLERHPELLDL